MRDADDKGGRSAEEQLALAHALRTPLTSLALGLGLLDDGVLGALDDGQREVVRTLVGEVGRLMLLVERHLDTGLLGVYAGPVERLRVDLSELVRQAAVPIERQACSLGVRLCFTLPPGIGVVADPVKLAWVVVSLMGNALRYSPSGAAIDVGIARVEDEVTLSVRDRGPGLAPEVAARVFDRDGGPGLFLAREIVEAHGGRIAVAPADVGEGETSPSSSGQRGGGSTFIITLPLAGAASGVGP